MINEDVQLFLKTLGYKLFPGKPEWPYLIKNLYQKAVESDRVCDLNKVLRIDVNEYQFDGGYLSYEVRIIGQHGIWWNLGCYSLSEEQLLDQLETIELTLVKLYNAI